MKVDGHMPMLVVLLLPMVGLLGAQAVATHGPRRGTLILQGGVGLNRPIAAAFVARAGGPQSHIVVIPTAMVGDAGPPGDWRGHIASRVKGDFGVATVTVLHTIERADADVDTFVEPLRRATGVWISGGFPPNLVRIYLGTRTERAIKDLLDRGGVVGGESAGAMIQGSWLDTTDSEWTPEILGLIQRHGTGAGFGLLTNAAVFPHFDERGPASAVKESATHPDQLAIGIDNETALVVRGALAEVVGSGTVSMYDGSGRSAPNVVILRSGDRYDLSTRRKQ
jgi:cyanophycinase